MGRARTAAPGCCQKARDQCRDDPHAGSTGAAGVRFPEDRPSSIALIIVGYESLNPLPAWPVKLAAPIVVVWLGIGVLVLFGMLSSGRSGWITRAGDAIAEVPESATAHEHRHHLL